MVFGYGLSGGKIRLLSCLFLEVGVFENDKASPKVLGQLGYQLGPCQISQKGSSPMDHYSVGSNTCHREELGWLARGWFKEAYHMYVEGYPYYQVTFYVNVG